MKVYYRDGFAANMFFVVIYGRGVFWHPSTDNHQQCDIIGAGGIITKPSSARVNMSIVDLTADQGTFQQQRR